MEPPRRKGDTTLTSRPAYLEGDLALVRSWKDVPPFEQEDDEGRFWSAHQLDARLLQMSIHRNDVRESTTITLRFDPRMLSRIKRIARRRYLNYQSMIKQWLSERMEQEMKEG
jgi:predicted DNA binding CopG/RHH family protein